jgi:hypothetical protein
MEERRPGTTKGRFRQRWNGTKERNMLGTGIYPITIAEMLNYTKDADQYFDVDEHEQLKEYLAWISTA